MHALQTDDRHIVPKARSNGRPKTVAHAQRLSREFLLQELSQNKRVTNAEKKLIALRDRTSERYVHGRQRQCTRWNFE